MPVIPQGNNEFSAIYWTLRSERNYLRGISRPRIGPLEVPDVRPVPILHYAPISQSTAPARQAPESVRRCLHFCCSHAADGWVTNSVLARYPAALTRDEADSPIPSFLRLDMRICGDACDSSDVCDPAAISQRNRRGSSFRQALHFNRHGGSPLHFAIAPAAQATVLSRWHEVQGLGILYLSVISGEMKRNVCAWTIAPGTPSPSIAGM